MANLGSMKVENLVEGILTVLNNMMTMENTGKYVCVSKDKVPKKWTRKFVTG